MYIFGYFFQKGHFLDSSKKRDILTKDFGGRGADDPLPPTPSASPVPEGLFYQNKF